jgi:hypothetical protein
MHLRGNVLDSSAEDWVNIACSFTQIVANAYFNIGAGLQHSKCWNPALVSRECFTAGSGL